jgi:hypothetical protein
LALPQLGQRCPGSRVVSPVATGTSDALQSMQKRASAGFSSPQFAQRIVFAILLSLTHPNGKC